MSKIICVICLIFSAIACKAPQFENQIRRSWSVKFSLCACQWYDQNKFEKISKLIPCEKFFEQNFPCKDGQAEGCFDPTIPNYMYCDDLIGYSKEDWALKITPKGRELRRFLIDYGMAEKKKR